jgi:pimeloyl-ACP methyl ester carboxylesterase
MATAAGVDYRFPITSRGLLLLATAAVMPPPLRGRLTARAILSPGKRHRFGDTDRPADPMRRRSNGSFRGLIGQAAAIFRHSAASRLSQIGVPTLIIHGECDELIDPENARYLARVIPGAAMELWPGAGHDLATEDPKRVAESVRRHIRQLDNDGPKSDRARGS